jgi:DNA-binding transcriptional ArsR family regulator
VGYIVFIGLTARELKETPSAERTLRHEVKPMSRNDPGMTMTTLNALAEPNRMKIVELLRDGPLTVGEIADRLRLRQPQASKHLKVLSDAGLLEVTAEGNRRYYRLRSEPFQSLDSWLKSFRRVMEDRYDNLDAYLRELQGEGNP